jgi:DNA-directed RNA polymerase specialized sigma24 family protein
VKSTPGTLEHGGASFATTHWSVIAQSALTDAPEAANALAQLCESYSPPIYSFIRRRGYSPSDAQDLTQSFVAFFLRTKAYARTDRLHGKFRSFLLASVKNFLADNWDRNQAIRRGGGYALLTGSPAIEAGNPSFTPPPDQDQRGSPFIRVFHDRIDVGSFESQPRPRPTPARRP